jgi:hypothetical protein
VAIDDCGREVEEFAVAQARVLAQHFEGTFLVDGMALHQDAFGTLCQRAATSALAPPVLLVKPVPGMRSTGTLHSRQAETRQPAPTRKDLAMSPPAGAVVWLAGQ